MTDPLRHCAEAIESNNKGRSSEHMRTANPRSNSIPATLGLHSERHAPHPHLVRHKPGETTKKPLRVMKFGGTSVGDASCIERVVDIVRDASRESDLVVVVSAMNGVTNQLVEAACRSEAGDSHSVAAIFGELRKRHEAALCALIHLSERRQLIAGEMRELLHEGDRLCQEAILRRELTPRVRDAISGLGERLSVRLVAAALAERNVPCEAIEATELIVTDSCHGAAEPSTELTRERCEARLRPLLLRGVVPVVTGFIGATPEGALTTLGRNSSDYSGTIVGAALDAEEVILWTDVDGILTADPKLVPEARPIREMSYREASDLADLGAKVLHARTLRPVIHRGISVSIRNTFAPKNHGTKITLAGCSSDSRVTALTASSDVALITVRGSGALGASEVLRRALAAADAVRDGVRLMPQSLSAPDEVCIIVPSTLAERAMETLRCEIARALGRELSECFTLHAAVAIVTVVSRNMLDVSATIDRLSGALSRERVDLLAFASSSSKRSLSLVVAHRDMKAALNIAHQEFQLGAADSLPFPGSIPQADWDSQTGGD
jgi:bifunctional aspartokinase / homoserine dehydrogenase 1